MSRSLKLYITGLVGASAVALVITSLAFGLNEGIALRFSGHRRVRQRRPSWLSDLRSGLR